MENKSLKLWKTFAIILIALNITLIILLLLRPPMGRPPFAKEGGDPGKFIIEKLKFTEQQETKFNKLKEAHHESIEILSEEGKNLRKLFFDGLTSDVVNTNKDSLANKIAENQKQIELLTYNHFVEVKKICTPDQKIIFNDIIQDIIEKISSPPPPPPPDGRMHDGRR